MLIQENREDLGEFFSFSPKREKSWKNKILPLIKIQEVSENYTETVISNKTIQEKFEIENASSADNSVLNQKGEVKPPSKYLCQFFSKLLMHEKIYHFFVGEALSSQVIFKKVKIRGKSLISFNSKRLNLKRQSITPVLKINDYINDNESSISDYIPVCKSSRKGFLKDHPFMKTRVKRSFKPSSDSSSTNSRSYISTPAYRFGRLNGKKPGLNPGNLKLREIFDEITGGRSRFTQEDFKKFLCKRYPEQVSDTFLQQLSFRNGGYDDYISGLNRLINDTELKHLELCFNIFDFNKDKQICRNDAYKALELRTDSYYDNDIALIIEMFNLKKKGKVPSMKLRRKSTLSLMKKKKKKKSSNLSILLMLRPKSPETAISINFQEFCVIKFMGRPQLFLDFLEYTCHYNFLKEKGLLIPTPIHSKRNSEKIVIEMNTNPDYHDLIRKNDKYDYYCQLDDAMILFPRTQAEDLLKKFKFLQSEDDFKLNVITKSSMIRKFPELLGFNSPFFSGRFYECLSQSKDLTKPRFLKRINYFLQQAPEVAANKLAFELYDSRNDSKLTADEVYHMFESLPISSPAYKECHKMIDLFILSIYERLRSKIKGIGYTWFCRLVKISLIGSELLEFLTTPFEKCLGRQSYVFNGEEDGDALDKHNNTRNSLLKLLD